MNVFGLLFLWWIVGVISAIIGVKILEGEVLISDVFKSLLAGFLGPAISVFIIIFIISERTDWWDKKIF